MVENKEKAKPFKAEYAIDMIESAYAEAEEETGERIAPDEDVISVFSQALAVYSHMEPGAAAALLKDICDYIDKKSAEFTSINADAAAAEEAAQEEGGPEYDEADWAIPEDFWELPANFNPFANLIVLNRLIAFTFVNDGYSVERDDDGEIVLDAAGMERLAFFITLFGHNVLEDTDNSNWTHRIEEAFGYYHDVIVSDAFIDQDIKAKGHFRG